MSASDAAAVASAVASADDKRTALARVLVADRRVTLLDAAKAVGIGAEEAAAFVTAPGWAEIMREVTPPAPTFDEIQRRFHDEAPASLQALIDVRDSAEREADRRAAAKDLLEFAGHTPLRRVVKMSFALPAEKRKQMREVVGSGSYAGTARAIIEAALVDADERTEH